jgi:hypothetical protein
MLAGCETTEEKEEKRKSYHSDAMEKWQDEAYTIYAPYHVG